MRGSLTVGKKEAKFVRHCLFITAIIVEEKHLRYGLLVFVIDQYLHLDVSQNHAKNYKSVLNNWLNWSSS